MKQHRAAHGCGLGVVLSVLLFAGCAGEQPKSQPSTKQIQEDSDRFFQQLRQEEQERGAGAEHRQ